MYPGIPWELVGDPLGSADCTLGTTAQIVSDVEHRLRSALYVILSIHVRLQIDSATGYLKFLPSPQRDLWLQKNWLPLALTCAAATYTYIYIHTNTHNCTPNRQKRCVLSKISQFVLHISNFEATSIPSVGRGAMGSSSLSALHK